MIDVPRDVPMEWQKILSSTHFPHSDGYLINVLESQLRINGRLPTVDVHMPHYYDQSGGRSPGSRVLL